MLLHCLHVGMNARIISRGCGGRLMARVAVRIRAATTSAASLLFFGLCSAMSVIHDGVVRVWASSASGRIELWKAVSGLSIA